MADESFRPQFVNNKFHHTITLLFSAVYAHASESEKLDLLRDPYTFTALLNSDSNRQLNESLSGLDRLVLEKFTDGWKQPGLRKVLSSTDNNQAVYDETGIRYFVQNLKSGSHTDSSRINKALTDTGYFQNLSAIHTLGLKNLIAVYGYNGMDFHPWAAIEMDAEEITDLGGDFFFEDLSFALSNMGIDTPDVDMYYADDGSLLLQLDMQEYELVRGSEAGEWFGYITGMNLLKTLSEMIQQAGRLENIYDHNSGGSSSTALILTEAQFNAVINAKPDSEKYQKPFQRQYSDIKK